MFCSLKVFAHPKVSSECQSVSFSKLLSIVVNWTTTWQLVNPGTEHSTAEEDCYFWLLRVLHGEVWCRSTTKSLLADHPVCVSVAADQWSVHQVSCTFIPSWLRDFSPVKGLSPGPLIFSGCFFESFITMSHQTVSSETFVFICELQALHVGL